MAARLQSKSRKTNASYARVSLLPPPSLKNSEFHFSQSSETPASPRPGPTDFTRRFGFESRLFVGARLEFAGGSRASRKFERSSRIAAENCASMVYREIPTRGLSASRACASGRAITHENLGIPRATAAASDAATEVVMQPRLETKLIESPALLLTSARWLRGSRFAVSASGAHLRPGAKSSGDESEDSCAMLRRCLSNNLRMAWRLEVFHRWRLDNRTQIVNYIFIHGEKFSRKITVKFTVTLGQSEYPGYFYAKNNEYLETERIYFTATLGKNHESSFL